ncbi:MAG: MFS transporter [Propionibacteriaceae bacterium]|nr:MFS transporter [Propionibacteriaceae bacterium]
MPRNVWVLSGISLAVAVGFGVVAPVLPMFAVSFGVNEFAAGAVISAFALMRFATASFVGRANDRFGHRRVLIAGILIVAVSSAFTGLAPNYLWLILVRGIGGIGSAMFSVSGMTVLLASVGSDLRGRAAGMYQGGFLVGAVLGPAIGGVFARISLQMPFFFYAGTLVVAAAVGLGLKSIQVTTSASDTQTARSLREVIRDTRFHAACAAHLVQGWNNNGTRSTLVPLFVIGYLATTPADAALQTGIAMAIAAGVQIALILPGGYLTDKYGRKIPMIVGAVISAIALAMVPWSTHIAMLATWLGLSAVGAALLGTAPAATLGDVAGTGADRAVAIYSMSGDLGSIVGPLAAGAIASAFGFLPAFLLGSGFWLISVVLSVRMRNTSQPATELSGSD